jgi:hypothetical protein
VRKVLGALGVVVVATLLAVSSAGSAQASTPTLVSSSPAAKARLGTWPDAVTLTFSEKVAAGTPLVRVDGPDGAVASSGRATSDGRTVTQRLAPEVAEGEYALRWTVVLVDGTQLAGTVPFTYGTGAKPAGRSRTVVATGKGVQEARSSPAAGALMVGIIAVGVVWGFRRLRSAFGR